MSQEVLKELYKKYTGHDCSDIIELPSSGSNRHYFRLTGEPSLIGAVGNNLLENEAFLYMDEHFYSKGLNVPKVVAVSDDHMCYLQEDLGDVSLFSSIVKGRLTRVFSEDEKDLIRQTIRLLPEMQFKGAEGMDFSKCHPASEFTCRSILWDLNYFKYCFCSFSVAVNFRKAAVEIFVQSFKNFILQVRTVLILKECYGKLSVNFFENWNVRNYCICTAFKSLQRRNSESFV